MNFGLWGLVSKIHRWQEQGICSRDAYRVAPEASNTAPCAYATISLWKCPSYSLASVYCLLHFFHAYKQLWLTSPGFRFWFHYFMSLAIVFKVHFFYFNTSLSLMGFNVLFSLIQIHCALITSFTILLSAFLTPCPFQFLIITILYFQANTYEIE